MNKRAKVIIIIVVLLAVIGVVTAGIYLKKPTQKTSETSMFSERVSEQLKKGRPFLVVFTYRGECCESTKEFFLQYETNVRNAADPYKDRLGLVWVDVSIQDKEIIDDILENATKYNTKMMYPIVTVVDNKGNSVKELEGMVDTEKLKGAIEEVLK